MEFKLALKLLIAIATQQGSPQEEPVVSYDSFKRAVCFNETSDPVDSIQYEAIIKIHGAPLWTSEVVQGSQCIEIPIDLYRKVSCESFSLIFITMDEFGEEIHTIQQDIDLEDVTIQVHSITSDSSSVTLECSGSEDSILELILTQTYEQSVLPKYITTSCNTTQHFNSLQPETSYTLNVARVLDKEVCSLTTRQFITKKTDEDRSNDRNEIVVVEGRSTNVNIICGLDRINNPPLYWIINQTMYDMSNLPYIFKTTAYGTLTLETVNRRMNHWEIQCVRVTVEELIYGQMATLRVIYDPIIPDLGTYSLEPSYLGRIILNHQDIYIGANETFLSWSYNPDSDSPCAVSRFYKLGLYSRTGSGDVQFLESMDSMKENITINSSLLYSSNSNTLIYFNVSANGSGEACTTTEYLQTFSGLDHTVIFANGNSTSIEISAEFKDSSLQLIWSTDEFAQCVCPLVEELLNICSCNRRTNPLSLSNNTITISQIEGLGYLAVYLVNSTLISCCNIRSIERIYRVFFEGSGPQELTLSYDREDRSFCVFFDSTNDPKYPITYQATITSYSDHIWRSETMLTPKCIYIPMEFHHNIVCSPFNLTLYVMDSFEEEIQAKQLEIDTNNITAAVLVNSITEDSINITLNCHASEYDRDSSALSLTLMQGEKTVFQNLTFCNTTKHLEDLQSGTDYTLIVNREFYYEAIFCELSRSQIETKKRGLSLTDSVAVAMGMMVFILLTIIIVIATIIVLRIKKKQRKEFIN